MLGGYCLQINKVKYDIILTLKELYLFVFLSYLLNDRIDEYLIYSSPDLTYQLSDMLNQLIR